MKTVGRKAVKTQGARFASAAEIFWREPDAMHVLLVNRADALVGCPEGSPEAEEKELERITDVIDVYEAKRWPSGKVARGKGVMLGTKSPGALGGIHASYRQAYQSRDVGHHWHVRAGHGYARTRQLL